MWSTPFKMCWVVSLDHCPLSQGCTVTLDLMHTYRRCHWNLRRSVRVPTTIQKLKQSTQRHMQMYTHIELYLLPLVILYIVTCNNEQRFTTSFHGITSIYAHTWKLRRYNIVPPYITILCSKSAKCFLGIKQTSYSHFHVYILMSIYYVRSGEPSRLGA